MFSHCLILSLSPQIKGRTETEHVTALKLRGNSSRGWELRAMQEREKEKRKVELINTELRNFIQKMIDYCVWDLSAIYTFTILDVKWCILMQKRSFVEMSCLNCLFGCPPPLITDLSCFECVVSSNSEWWISPFHMASSYGLVQGSKGESVYSPVMSAHDITWVHSSAGSLGRYLGEITQAKRRLAGSPFIRLQDELFHTNLSLGAFF